MRAPPRCPCAAGACIKNVLADAMAARTWCVGAPGLCVPHEMPNTPLQCITL